MGFAELVSVTEPRPGYVSEPCATRLGDSTGTTKSVWAEVLHPKETRQVLGIHSSEQRDILADLSDTLHTC